MNKLALSVLALVGSPAFAQAPAPKAVPVTADNFIRAESDVVFAGLVAQTGLGKFYHNRVIQRGNRDTLYSTVVFDLDAGPVTITLPDAGKRFLTMIVIDEDHYAFTVVYAAARHTLSRAQVGTRYALAAIRILADPNDPRDVARVNALQDAVKLEQPGGSRSLRGAQLGRSQPSEGTRSAGGAGGDHVKGWNYMVRLYRPRAEILNGTWKFPEAQRLQ